MWPLTMMQPQMWKMIYRWSTIFLLYLMPASSAQSTKNEVLFEYFPSTPNSTSDVLQATLSDHDYRNNIKILPHGKDVIANLAYKQEIRLLYPIVKPGPVSLSLAACRGALTWTLFWRPHSSDALQIVHAGMGPLSANRTGPGVTGPGDTRTQFPVQKSGSSTRKLERKRDRKSQFRSIEVTESNFTTRELDPPPFRYVPRTDGDPILELELTRGQGTDPWVFQREDSQSGLYIIKVVSLSAKSSVHAAASRRVVSEEERRRKVDSFGVKEDFKGHSVTLSWRTRSPEGTALFCLVVSRQKRYPSLCAAREFQRQSRLLPTNLADGSLMLGCTPASHYTLPSTPELRYFVSVWEHGSIAPILQATLRAKAHRKFRRLKPGRMVPFTLTSGGKVNARFLVRKAGKNLHVAAVSCYGGIKLVVLGAGDKRETEVTGREALHLAIRHVRKGKLTIRVSPQPPLQSDYRVHLVATHYARKLPIPRLPRNARVKVAPLGCSSASVEWLRSPSRGATYCLVLRSHPGGRPPQIRPPIQCGWEEVIRRPGYFHHLDCFGGRNGRRQNRTVGRGVLTPGSSFLVNVLVRHPLTGKTLTLLPAMLTLPSCSSSSANDSHTHGDQTTPRAAGNDNINYKQLVAK